jgi:hypothetical protein
MITSKLNINYSISMNDLLKEVSEMFEGDYYKLEYSEDQQLFHFSELDSKSVHGWRVVSKRLPIKKCIEFTENTVNKNKNIHLSYRKVLQEFVKYVVKK